MSPEYVKVRALAQYLPGQSSPEGSHYVFAYTIRIHNAGHQPVRLLARHWYVEYGEGQVTEVEGEGVVGEQPLIEPGEAYEYTSGTPLPTPSASMHGSYHMVVPDTGEEIDVPVPRFPLEAFPTAH
ncbi:Co2+/Mg2+ efflux protein ApaG [Thiohalorhabdus methylotrophus]|uniref:Co2+/Mg2+ efflux protein ApaG n=1 Tax=Thiohalorhabdus methylotrophus TaxID=3242694 RepID=A0ABV4TVE5_9GAMM